MDKIGFKPSKIQVGRINEQLKTKLIPAPKLIRKYHKKPIINGEFQTNMVIQGINFTATFTKVGYLGIRALIYIHLVDYYQNIQKISQANQCWGKLNRKIEKVKTISIYVVAMYPLINFLLVKKQILLQKNSPKHGTLKIYLSLNLIGFDMIPLIINL